MQAVTPLFQKFWLEVRNPSDCQSCSKKSVRTRAGRPEVLVKSCVLHILETISDCHRCLPRSSQTYDHQLQARLPQTEHAISGSQDVHDTCQMSHGAAAQVSQVLLFGSECFLLYCSNTRFILYINIYPRVRSKRAKTTLQLATKMMYKIRNARSATKPEETNAAQN